MARLKYDLLVRQGLLFYQGCSESSFFSPTPVLIQKVGTLILVRILFATQLWNTNPEKILLA